MGPRTPHATSGVSRAHEGNRGRAGSWNMRQLVPPALSISLSRIICSLASSSLWCTEARTGALGGACEPLPAPPAAPLPRLSASTICSCRSIWPSSSLTRRRSPTSSCQVSSSITPALPALMLRPLLAGWSGSLSPLRRELTSALSAAISLSSFTLFSRMTVTLSLKFDSSASSTFRRLMADAYLEVIDSKSARTAASSPASFSTSALRLLEILPMAFFAAASFRLSGTGIPCAIFSCRTCSLSAMTCSRRPFQSEPSSRTLASGTSSPTSRTRARVNFFVSISIAKTCHGQHAFREWCFWPVNSCSCHADSASHSHIRRGRRGTHPLLHLGHLVGLLLHALLPHCSILPRGVCLLRCRLNKATRHVLYRVVVQVAKGNASSCSPIASGRNLRAELADACTLLLQSQVQSTILL
mmetsp:Transcript_25539/g.75504  ORF Transcript_25539/g.75504 Transcript_25539/m.75504 type:complete len:414 (-) Transcript_25539:274-1515(-)